MTQEESLEAILGVVTAIQAQQAEVLEAVRWLFLAVSVVMFAVLVAAWRR